MCIFFFIRPCFRSCFYRNCQPNKQCDVDLTRERNKNRANQFWDELQVGTIDSEQRSPPKSETNTNNS